MNESDIVFESNSGRFFARAATYGFDVYENGSVVAKRVARIGYKGPAGLERVRAEIARREES